MQIQRVVVGLAEVVEHMAKTEEEEEEEDLMVEEVKVLTKKEPAVAEVHFQ